MKMVALFTLVLGIFAATDKAHAITMNTQTGIGGLSISVDTTVSAGVSVRLKDVHGDYIASQSGGNDYVRGLPTAVDLGRGLTARLTAANLPASEIAIAVGTAVTGAIIGVAAGVDAGLGILALYQEVDAAGLPVSFGFKNENDKNFAGNQNGDDGRLNFQKKGDITGATFKVLTEIQASLSTAAGDFTFFTRVNAFYDPVLHADFGLNNGNRAYDRGRPGDAGRRELGRDLQLLDFALSWDYDIPAGDFIGSIPVAFKVGKLAANNWGEATFSFTGISQGIVLNIPASRRPGAQIKEILGTEWMVYTSIGLPFDIGVSAYYQFHHTPWDLSPSDSPFAISDTPNPSNDAAGLLQLSGLASSGTFHRNCGTGGGLIAAAMPADCGTAGLNSIVHFTNTYYNPNVVDNDGRSVADQRAEDVRFAQGDLLNARVVHLDADNQGQFGAQLSYYFPYLNGIEFTFSYQNIHSRLPYARIKTDGAPVVTIATISGSNTLQANVLNGLGCTGVNPAIPFNTGGYLQTGQFLDPALQPSTGGNTTGTGYVPIAGPITGGAAGVFTALGVATDLAVKTALRVPNPVGVNYLSGLADSSNAAGRSVVSDRNNLKLGLDTTHFGGKASGSVAGMRDRAIFHGDASYRTQTTTTAIAPSLTNPFGRAPSRLQALAAAADVVLTNVGTNAMITLPGATTPTSAIWTHSSIATNIANNGMNRYDLARINCAIFASQPKFGGTTASPSPATAAILGAAVGVSPALGILGALSPIGTEYLALQYNNRMELYYPQNLKIIGMGFNTTLPWLEWGLQAEVAWRPDTPLQQDVTEQLISHASAQGSGQSLGDAAGIGLAPSVTSIADGTAGVARIDTDWSFSTGAAVNGIGGLVPTLSAFAAGTAGAQALPLQAGAITAIGLAVADAGLVLTTAQAAMVTAAVTAATAAATAAAIAARANPTDTSDLVNAAASNAAAATTLGFAASTPAVARAVLGALTPLTVATAEGRAVGSAFNSATGGRSAHSFAAGFNPNVFECYLSGECGGDGIIEADMLNVTIGVTALYNGSHPFIRLLGADQGVFLAEVNAITFLDDIPGGWPGSGAITRGNKHSTLACVRYSGTELPLGALVGLDSITDFTCTPDKTSVGYSLLGFLDYNNVFGTAWRIRPSMAIRHGVYGNTPSPIPGWRQDALSVNTSVSFAFQNSLNLAVGYVGYFDVGHGYYNVNARLDTFSFNVSYAF